MVIGMQQWGYGTAGTITYPIQFTEIAYTAFACDIAESNENIVSVATNPPEINQIVVRPSAAQTITWLVIGKQQWRMLEIQATGQNVDFPIAFTEWCVACGSRVTGTGGNPTTLGANAAFSKLATLTHAIVFSVETQDYYLLAAGIQQWGYEPSVSTRTVEYPIAYLITPPTVVTSSNGADAKSAVGNITLTSFSTINRAGTQSVWWFSIGVQQWGYSAFIYGGKKVTFPIPYIAQCYGVVSQNVQTTTDFIVCAINDVDTTGFWDSNGSYIGIYWFAFGKQQWGYSPYNAEKGLVSIALQLSSSEIISICSQQIARSATDKNGTQQVLFVSFDETSINFRVVNTEAATDTAISFYWFGLFKQQWGLTGNDPGDGGASAQLSIPITALIFGQARTTSSEVLSSVFSVDVDNTSTLSIDSSNIQYKGGYAYLIGCKQQWGCGQHNDNITFSMLYSEIPVTVMGANAYAAYCGIKDNTLTVKGFTGQCCTYSSWSPKSFYWLAIGQQQIKRQHYHYRYHTTLFLQIVYRHHKYQWRHY